MGSRRSENRNKVRPISNIRYDMNIGSVRHNLRMTIDVTIALSNMVGVNHKNIWAWDRCMVVDEGAQPYTELLLKQKGSVEPIGYCKRPGGSLASDCRHQQKNSLTGR